MRITLPSGTEAEIDMSVAGATQGIVIAPDIFGLRPLFDEFVARIAREWQVKVIAVEPFPGRQLPLEIEPRVQAMPSMYDDHHLRDLEEGAAALGVERVGLMGFCMGGMYCHKSSRSDRFAKIASFYGMIHVPESWRGPKQGDPIEILTKNHADRVLAIVGLKDPYTPTADIAELKNVGVTVVEYEDAEHGFAHDATRPSHRPVDAADAFARAKAWLLD
ncbi:MAG: dienelactone hydrolase family protein [Ilumatobacteraceae bacterium]